MRVHKPHTADSRGPCCRVCAATGRTNAQHRTGSSLFVGAKGAGIDETTLQKTFTAACADAELGRRATPHTLRQSYATHLVEAGISLRTVQDGGKPGERYLVPVRALSAGFWGRFLRMARRALTESSLPDLPDKPWVVYAKPALHGAKQVLANLGRYVHRTALAESQLVHCNERSVAFRYLDHRDVRGGRS